MIQSGGTLCIACEPMPIFCFVRYIFINWFGHASACWIGVLQDEAGQHVSPRFGIEQEKVDGSVKLRAIDDFTFSWLNGHTAASEKLRCDGLDLLFEVMRLQMENGSKVC